MRARLFALALCLGCYEFPTHDPTLEAQEYAKHMDGKVTGVQCTTRDSDNDGYVSCSVFREGRDPYAIECTYRYRETGCKIVQPKIIRREE